MYYVILTASLGFLAFFLWYLIADTGSARRLAGLGAILASLLTCGLALVPLNKSIRLGLDLQGGTEFLLAVQGNPSRQALDEAAAVIHHRLDTLGTREITIVPEGADRLKIQIPGLSGSEVEAVAKQLSQVAKLDFRLLAANDQELLRRADENGGLLPYDVAGDYEILPLLSKDKAGKEVRTRVVVERKIGLSGKHVTRASRSIAVSGENEVVLNFDDIGTTQFGEFTGANVGRRLAIVLDQEVHSAPVLRERISQGTCNISGSMTALECDELANVLQNPLQNPIKILNQSSVDASLGADSIRSGYHAGLLALALVVTFMVVYYRLSGAIAVLALLVNLVLLFGLLAQFHFTLTLPGIAGIVLTIGMAVDANVLIYERIRDERAAGKPAQSAIDLGFEKAFSAITDSNVTTLIPAAVLAYLGTGPLRGFAITLVLGIIANLFAALIVSRNAFDWILRANPNPNLGMMQFIKSPRFDFLKYRHAGLVLSLLVIAAGALTVTQRGESVLGVDFRGGDSVTLAYDEKIEIGALRTALTAAGQRDIGLLYASGTAKLTLTAPEQQGAAVAAILQQKFPQAHFKSQAVQKIGAQVGGEMKQRALLALLAGLFGILLYAAIRFEWSYAVAAAVGQLHDVLIALSVMALLGSELTLTLVGALLTIAGYSINDKIVVFDRIREGTSLREKGTFYEVINRSLNLTLARTILTGSTCLLATLALILFGGPIIRDLSLAMFVGIFSGIYSSHFISPGLAWWFGAGGAKPGVAKPVVLAKKTAVAA